MFALVLGTLESPKKHNAAGYGLTDSGITAVLAFDT